MSAAEELAKKKARLAELRKAKEERLNVAAAAPPPSLEQLLAAAGVPLKPSDPDPPPSDKPPQQSDASSSAESAAQSSRQATIHDRLAKLTISSSVILDIPCKTLERYEKVTQTEDTEAVLNDADDNTDAHDAHVPRKPTREVERSDKGTKDSEYEPAHTSDADEDKDERSQGQVFASEKELASLMNSEDFISFLGRTSKVMERALNQKSYDIFKDYTKDTSTGVGDEQERRLFKLMTLRDEARVRGRPITKVEWSDIHPELMLAAMMNVDMDTRGSVSADAMSEGLVCVWNAHGGENASPEYHLQCPTGVCSALFHKFSANIVIGGTQAGQIVVWDARTRPLPVARTPLSTSGHTHAICGLHMLGTKHAHSVASICREGHFCTWSLEKLAEPLQSVVIADATKEGDASIAATCFAFPSGNTDDFICGTEDGLVLGGNRDFVNSEQSRCSLKTRMIGHSAPVTGLHIHHTSEAPRPDMSHLVLSSSMDCSWRVWDRKRGVNIVTADLASTESILDARWSPSHPAMFATADAGGDLRLWNLCESAEAAVAISHAGEGAGGLNCIEWSADGRTIAAGDAHGGLHLFGVRGEVGDSAWDDLHDMMAAMGRTDAVDDE